jgi:acyl-CoA reductase-like NAD-dependent aldehyde dehydrogenase
MSYYSMQIGGKPMPASDDATMRSYEPATGRPIASIARASEEDVAAAVSAARAAFDSGPWPRRTGAQRAMALRAVAAALATELDHLAELECRDSGATIRKAKQADVPAAIAAFEWSAHWAEQLSGTVPEPVPPAGEYVHWRPYGVVAAVIPWNFPLTLAAWRIAPAIAAGNACVVKPASFTSITALELARIISACDVPAGVVNVICGAGSSVGEALVGHPDIDLAAFTGSDLVGDRVKAVTGEAHTRVLLDLGGKSANLVLDDADLELAVAGAAWASFFHNGQICMAGSRIIVSRRLYEPFLALLADQATRLRLGDPLDPATDLGPLISRQQVRIVDRYVKAGIAEGARLVCGGSRPEPGQLSEGLDAGAYYRPTVLADVDNASTIAREEVFGPVAAVIVVDSDEAAIAAANDSKYSLSAGVWSADPERARQVAEQLRARRVWINDYRMVDLASPGSSLDADPCLSWLTTGLTDYRTMHQVQRADEAAPGSRAHFNLLRPGLR